MSKVGVLALQGAFQEHIEILKKLGTETFEVRNSKELNGVDALIIPGGESTVMGMQLKLAGMLEPLKSRINNDMPTWGTCAGLILLSDEVDNQKQDSQEIIGGLAIETIRNHYGRQNESFVSDIVLDNNEKQSAVFIRAPFIKRTEAEVETLATYKDSPVAVKQKNILGTCFHPELSDTTYWHEYFLSMTK